MAEISGRENFRRTIEHDEPAWLPMMLDIPFQALYEKNKKKESHIRLLQAKMRDDILNLSPQYKGSSAIQRDRGITRWTDHWGTGWLDDGHGGRTHYHPLECNYDLMNGYPFPDPRSLNQFKKVDETLLQKKGRYVLGSVWFTLFERLWMLRGFNNILLDPYIENERFCKLRDLIVEYNMAIIDQWLERRVDGIFFSDDWGSQQGLLIAPDDWRVFFKPSYKRLFDQVRQGNAHVWMHLCGNVMDILPDLVEIGLDVLNPVQPQAMDIHVLSEKFGERLCFCGGADVQGVLVNGTPDDVQKQARELVEVLGAHGGGYIASTSHGIMPETPLDNIIALCESFLAYT